MKNKQLTKGDLVLRIDSDYSPYSPGKYKYFTMSVYPQEFTGNTSPTFNPDIPGLTNQNISLTLSKLNFDPLGWTYTTRGEMNSDTCSDTARSMHRINKHLQLLNHCFYPRSSLSAALPEYAKRVKAKAFVTRNIDQNNNLYWQIIPIDQIDHYINDLLSKVQKKLKK